MEEDLRGVHRGVDQCVCVRFSHYPMRRLWTYQSCGSLHALMSYSPPPIVVTTVPRLPDAQFGDLWADPAHGRLECRATERGQHHQATSVSFVTHHEADF